MPSVRLRLRCSRLVAFLVLATFLVLTTGCSPAPAPGDAPVAAPPSVSSPIRTTTSTTTTSTTTVPVPANVADLIVATTMTDRGRRLFLASAPAVEDQATFARNCGSDAPAGAATEARVHTQGCYVSGRIHLLAGDRAEARDLLSVVAAHELLHAAYASLGPPERTRIDAELDAARAGNDRLEERLRAYGTGPTIGNEIHSILGTEFGGLSPVLEAHYAQFFADRGRLVAVRQRTLGSREEQIRNLKTGIDALDTRITSLKDALDGIRATGDIRKYNANVGVINGLVTQYEADVADLNARIDEYNLLLGG